MADRLGPSMGVRIMEVSLIWRSVIERFHCITKYMRCRDSMSYPAYIMVLGSLGRLEMSKYLACMCDDPCQIWYWCSPMHSPSPPLHAQLGHLQFASSTWLSTWRRTEKTRAVFALSFSWSRGGQSSWRSSRKKTLTSITTSSKSWAFVNQLYRNTYRNKGKRSDRSLSHYFHMYRKSVS